MMASIEKRSSHGAIASSSGVFEIDIEHVGTKHELPPSILERLATSNEVVEAHTSEHTDGSDDLDQYRRFSNGHKALITTVLAFCAMLSPISSTMVLSALPEVAHHFNVTADIISLSNAIYLLCMGLSAFAWGPISSIYGRRWVCIAAAVQFCIFNIATAVAPTLAAFYVFRILTALQSTCLLIVGNSCLADIYEPTARATAVGWFALATVIGPAFGPFIGGVIITFRSWTVIFWLQAALGGLATFLLVVLLPETMPERKFDSLRQRATTRKDQILLILSWMSPERVVVLLFTYPNLLITGIASSALIWNMYAVLTPIRHLLNPRFHLTSPMQAGLFYIAPGCGYLAGSPFGGWWADRTVKRWIRKRGHRVPEDRLRSCHALLGIVTPASVLLYGWSVQNQFGGIPVPVFALFAQGMTQWLCFPSLNTYALDVMQSRGMSAEAIAGNYLIRYFFAAAGSAVCIPAIDAIGVGWFSTIGSAFLIVGALGVWATCARGEAWRTRIDARRSRTRPNTARSVTSRSLDTD